MLSRHPVVPQASCLHPEQAGRLPYNQNPLPGNHAASDQTASAHSQVPCRLLSGLFDDFADDVVGSALHLDVDAAYVFAEDAGADHLHAGEYEE